MSFQTPQYSIADLRKWASTGRIQLPDFQRSYKWDDERIRSLLVTILRGHPMGVIMLLKTGGQHVRFKPKPITGVASASEEPTYLLLDGQQRLTSLYQALTGDGVVDTEDDRKKNCGDATSWMWKPPSATPPSSQRQYGRFQTAAW